MLAFRSEGHLEGWLARGNPEGERMSLDVQWDLTQRWFAGRHLPGWRRRTREEVQAVFSSVGLTSTFWQL
ncbi:MAG: hypothetical protein QOG04_2160 [Actinomycetota bacterium]|jgi:hypothetical protein|nr:hypothetical protein [Actinomycetota bacterium]